jgi:hypothetical protein
MLESQPCIYPTPINNTSETSRRKQHGVCLLQINIKTVLLNHLNISKLVIDNKRYTDILYQFTEFLIRCRLPL